MPVIAVCWLLTLPGTSGKLISKQRFPTEGFWRLGRSEEMAIPLIDF